MLQRTVWTTRVCSCQISATANGDRHRFINNCFDGIAGHSRRTETEMHLLGFISRERSHIRNTTMFSKHQNIVTSDDTCPVIALDLYLSKLSPRCDALFHQPLQYPKQAGWYTAQPTGKQKLPGKDQDLEIPHHVDDNGIQDRRAGRPGDTDDENLTKLFFPDNFKPHEKVIKDTPTTAESSVAKGKENRCQEEEFLLVVR
ncbi:unnamed protein product [Mytilus edulis]|uniref:Uncharacterized protein n=1 Tax=Mytilus edulis TaxID=6550 RepID=A0A8S3PVD3_MYTED|nr:unnamed protein product [Mytilus edulis]